MSSQEWRTALFRAQMVDRTARAIVYLGWGSLSDTEEASLAGNPEFRDAVMAQVRALENEKEMERGRSEEKERLRKEEERLREQDEAIMSRKRPTVEIGQNQNLNSRRESDGLEQDGILVVDDVEADLDRICEFLAGTGLRIYRATNKDDALAIIRQEPIGMLVTDIVMPMYRLTTEQYKAWEQIPTTRHELLFRGVTTEPVEVLKKRIVKQETGDYSQFAGFQLLDEARAIIPWLPVIVVSRYADLGMARHALGAHVQDILSKKAHLRESTMLVASVKSHLLRLHQRIADVGSDHLHKFLATATEQVVTLKIVIPLLHKLGYRGIRHTHGVNECGLDVVFFDTDRLGTRRYMGAQIKNEKIHKDVGRPTGGNIIAILQQIEQAFASTLYLLPERTELELDRIFVISSLGITQPARDYIRKVLMGKVYGQLIEFWGPEKIVDLMLATHQT